MDLRLATAGPVAPRAPGLWPRIAAALAVAVLHGLPVCAGPLALKERAAVPAGFVRLADLAADPKDGTRFENLYLGRVEQGEKRAVSLEFIRRRLVREGYLTVEPRLPTGASHIEVLGVAPAPEAEPPPLADAAGGPLVPPAMGEAEKSTYAVLLAGADRGEVLSADKVELKKLPRIVSGAATSLEEVVGLRLDRSLQKGAVLLKNYLSRPPLVEKNQMVEIALSRKDIKITGLGRAMSDGMKGDIIEVRRGRQVLRARVAGPRSVEILEEP